MLSALGHDAKLIAPEAAKPFVKKGKKNDAADAAALCAAASRPDAVLVDVGLPDRDGIDLANELTELPWRPRVVLTSSDKDALMAIEARDDDHRLRFVAKEELASESLRRALLDG